MRGALAAAMTHTGDVAGARVLYEDLLPQGIAAEGEDSTGVLVLQTNLAALLADKLNDWAAARPLYEAVVVGKTAKYGAEYDSTLRSRTRLAIALEKLGEVAAAQREYDALLAGFTAARGARHPGTVNAQHGLARLLVQQLV